MSELDIFEPPSPFDPVEDWKAFLKRMEAEEQTHNVKDMIELAKETLAWKEKKAREEEERANKDRQED